MDGQAGGGTEVTTAVPLPPECKLWRGGNVGRETGVADTVPPPQETSGG